MGETTETDSGRGSGLKMIIYETLKALTQDLMKTHANVQTFSNIRTALE